MWLLCPVTIFHWKGPNLLLGINQMIAVAARQQTWRRLPSPLPPCQDHKVNEKLDVAGQVMNTAVISQEIGAT